VRLPGHPLLVAAGAAIGDALKIELKPGWREGAKLYAACVGDPGSKKTPMQGLAMRLDAKMVSSTACCGASPTRSRTA